MHKIENTDASCTCTSALFSAAILAAGVNRTAPHHYVSTPRMKSLIDAFLCSFAAVFLLSWRACLAFVLRGTRSERIIKLTLPCIPAKVVRFLIFRSIVAPEASLLAARPPCVCRMCPFRLRLFHCRLVVAAPQTLHTQGEFDAGAAQPGDQVAFQEDADSEWVLGRVLSWMHETGQYEVRCAQ